MTVNVATVTNTAGTTTTVCPTDVTCSKLGDGLNITLGDAAQCIYGTGTAPATANTAPNGDSVAIGSTCTDITNAANIQPGGTQAAKNPFSVAGTAGFSGLISPVYIQGTTATYGSKVVGGTTVKQWGPAESHVFTVTIGFPDRGASSTDNVYNGGQVGFDLVWIASQ